MGIQGNLLGGKFSKLVWILHYLTCKCLTTQVSKKPFEKKPVKKKKPLYASEKNVCSSKIMYSMWIWIIMKKVIAY